jgi:hypothetical protein
VVKIVSFLNLPVQNFPDSVGILVARFASSSLYQSLPILIHSDVKEEISMNITKFSLSLVVAIALPLFANMLTATASAQEVSQHRPNQPIETINLADSMWLNRGEHQSYQFYGEAQQQITVLLFSREFDTYLEVYDTDGRLMSENDDSNLTNSSVQLTLPHTGFYTAVARGFSPNDQGHYALQIQTPASRVPARPPLPTPPQSPSRSESRLINHLFPGETLQHTFQGRSGESITLQLESSEFDTYLRIYGPDGRLLAENDDIPYQSNSRIQVRLSQDGNYTAEVRAFSPDSEGDYTLIIGP